MYYNTTQSTGTELTRFRKINSGQDATILAWFKRNPGKKLTPFDAKRSAGLHRYTPIDSIRRSFNTLTACGEIVKLDEMRMERYGRNNHLWILKTKKR